jgi:acetyl esterase/lipase
MRGARIVVAALLVLAGCASEPSVAGIVPPSSDYAGVTFVDDLDFGAPDGIRLDVCLPDDDDADDDAGVGGGSPAIVSVHGGGWQRGDKAQRPWRDTCAWLASEGFVVIQPNYRLAPEHPYPAAIEDVSRAVVWLRAAEQVERFGHDPARIGAFGDSAGGNLAALLGASGEGSTDEGTRVSAVVELSAPIDLTAEGASLGDLSEDFQRIQLDYLGCDSYDDCAIAEAASPLGEIDPSDPPFFIAHSTEEFIPFEQAETLASRLEAADVPVEVVEVAGSGHALDLLDHDLRDRIAAWLHEKLGS